MRKDMFQVAEVMLNPLGEDDEYVLSKIVKE